MTQYLRKATVGRRAYFSSLFGGTIYHSGEAWGQECEAAVCTRVPVLRHFLLFLHSRTSFYGVMPSTLRVGLPVSPNPDSSQTCAEICFHSDSKSFRIDKIYHHTWWIGWALIKACKGPVCTQTTFFLWEVSAPQTPTATFASVLQVWPFCIC